MKGLRLERSCVAGLMLVALGCTQKTIILPPEKAASTYGGCLEYTRTEGLVSCGGNYRTPTSCYPPDQEKEVDCFDRAENDVGPGCSLTYLKYRTPIHDMTCDDWRAAGSPDP